SKLDEALICAFLHFGIHTTVFIFSHESLLGLNNFVLITSSVTRCHHVKAAQDTNNAKRD
ncbi:MAG: hypothetical protein ACI82I_003587, partial [Gammaproteobacteria bacterium]